jgi:hypothetical protein
MVQWNSETKCFTCTDWELDYSVKRSIYRLSTIPELCNFVFFDFRSIYHGKYYTLKNKYRATSMSQLNYWVDTIIYCCRYLGIKYRITYKRADEFKIRVEADCSTPTEEVPGPAGYMNPDVNRYKVTFAEHYSPKEGVWNCEQRVWEFTDDELKTSEKRCVNKLLQVPDVCKLVAHKDITKTKYGFILKNFYTGLSKTAAVRQLARISELCDTFHIPYTDSVVRYSKVQHGYMWWIQVFNTVLDKECAVGEKNENMYSLW